MNTEYVYLNWIMFISEFPAITLQIFPQKNALQLKAHHSMNQMNGKPTTKDEERKMIKKTTHIQVVWRLDF